MENITNIHLTDHIPTIYTFPRTIHYVQNGVQRKHHIFAERNGVMIIVYNKTRDVLTLVKQFRPSVYLSRIAKNDYDSNSNRYIDTDKYPPSLGVTYEFCAGLEDKDIPSEEIAREEILEECGYQVTCDDLERVSTFPNFMDANTGARTTFYYCEVSDEMRVHAGGGVDDEFIEVVEKSVEEVIEYATRESVDSPANFMFGLYWFLYNKRVPQC